MSHVNFVLVVCGGHKVLPGAGTHSCKARQIEPEQPLGVSLADIRSNLGLYIEGPCAGHIVSVYPAPTDGHEIIRMQTLLLYSRLAFSFVTESRGSHRGCAHKSWHMLVRAFVWYGGKNLRHFTSHNALNALDARRENDRLSLQCLVNATGGSCQQEAYVPQLALETRPDIRGILDVDAHGKMIGIIARPLRGQVRFPFLLPFGEDLASAQSPNFYVLNLVHRTLSVNPN